MDSLRLTIGGNWFTARWEAAAPKTVAAVHRLLPLRSQLIHVRWSGEAVWMPLGDLDIGVGFENQTSHPALGQILIYTGDLSECEILIAYGACLFSSKAGQLAGNHFATITAGIEKLPDLGRRVLWEGVQDVSVEAS
ncbi:MAG: DUF3830 family protein [Dehalococcoidia bacterium]